MKPFIARDTKQPLVVMGGYRIGEGGVIIERLVPPGINKPKAKKTDLELLEKHGWAGLEKKKFFGVLDRLKNSNI